ncbi:MAG: alpha/beta fold hydrolase [Bacillota bacterium]
MQYVSAKGCRLYYETRGQGRPLVLIHGLGSDHRMWGPQMDVFSKDHQVIAYDCRGHGASSPVPPGYQLADLAEDLARLLDGLKIGQAALVGVSFGGIVAQQFAVSYPERCLALVLSDTFSEVHFPDSFGAWLQVPVLRVLPRPILAQMIAGAYPKKRWRLAREELARAARNIRPGDVSRLRALINRVHLTEKLSVINCPTLVLTGDRWPVMVKYARLIHEAVPGSRLELVPSACDPSSLTNVEAFNRLVLDFLTSACG